MTGERFDLAEGDLCRYAVDKSYLRERLDLLLKDQLVDKPLSPDEHEPFVLGNYRMGDQRLPVALVSRLWEPKHADKMDTELRQSNLGLTLVLTTIAELHRRFLRPGIVVPVKALLVELDGAMQDRGTGLGLDPLLVAAVLGQEAGPELPQLHLRGRALHGGCDGTHTPVPRSAVCDAATATGRC